MNNYDKKIITDIFQSEYRTRKNIEQLNKYLARQRRKNARKKSADIVADIMNSTRKNGHAATIYAETLFYFNGKPYTKKEQVARCGNAVCPPMAEAVIRANMVDIAVKKPIKTMAELEKVLAA